MSISITELEQVLWDRIPLSRHMGVQLDSITPDQAVLNLPLKPNLNHKGTAFGGSIYSGCALAGYGLFLFSLQERGFTTNNIVISEGSIDYTKPVDGDAEIIAQWRSQEERDVFFNSLKSRGKARVQIEAQVVVQGKVSAHFYGTFVAIL